MIILLEGIQGEQIDKSQREKFKKLREKLNWDGVLGAELGGGSAERGEAEAEEGESEEEEEEVTEEQADRDGGMDPGMYPLDGGMTRPALWSEEMEMQEAEEEAAAWQKGEAARINYMSRKKKKAKARAEEHQVALDQILTDSDIKGDDLR